MAAWLCFAAAWLCFAKHNTVVGLATLTTFAPLGPGGLASA
ncbi:MAG TPA: hypothetical protein VGI40_04965 [Pirellulaceae bacterium]